MLKIGMTKIENEKDRNVQEVLWVHFILSSKDNLCSTINVLCLRDQMGCEYTNRIKN